MKVANNNLSVLPWYTSLQEQNHRKSYAFGDIYPLYAPNNMLLPFQIMRAKRLDKVISVNVYSSSGVLIKSITTAMKQAGLMIAKNQSTEFDVIIFPATLPMPIDIPIGQYYLSLSDGVETWFSDMITLVNDVSGYLKLEWWDIDNAYFDAGLIIYNIPSMPVFRNVLYLCTELGKPEYVFEEEGEERDGYFFPQKQISEKTYKFIFLASEYLCDVIRLVRMSDYVRITDKYGRVYMCDTFLITPKWQTQGNLASVETEFQTATVVKKIGRGYTSSNSGDFNNDFNNDFLND